MCRPTIGLSEGDVTRGTRARANAPSSAAPWRMTRGALLRGAGQEAGRVRRARRAAGRSGRRARRTRRPSRAAAASRQPPRWRGWLAITPTGEPSMRAKPTTRLRAQRGASSSSAPASTRRRIDVAHVVDLARRRRAAVADGSPAERRARRRQRQRAAARPGQVREQVAHELGRGDVVDGDEVGDAVARVDARAAELLGRDLLARDRLDHLRAGEEQPRARARHHHEVAERRRVGRAAGARARDDGDLRHARGGLRAEDRRVGVERRRALLQSRAAGVQEADDGRAGAVGRVDGARDRLAAGGARASRPAPRRPAPTRTRGARPRGPSPPRRRRPRRCARAGTCPGRRAGRCGRAGARSRRGWRRLRSCVHAARIARQAFWPPNPNEFESASFRSGASRGPSGT